MSERPYFNNIIVIPRLRVQNANAISSPLTHGFPAMSAFTGLMWALERKIQSAGMDIFFHAVGVVAHDTHEQVTDSYIKTFRLTRNPIAKDGSTSSIAEEGRMHMTISLVFAVQSEQLNADDVETVNTIKQIIESMRIAGGTVLPTRTDQPKQPARLTQPRVIPITSDADTNDNYRSLKRLILPGFVLVERQDLVKERWNDMRQQKPESSKLDALLSLSRFNWHWQAKLDEADEIDEADESKKGEWQHDRKDSGWLVPIPVGYGALSDLKEPGTVSNTRDQTTRFRYVESVYGLGEWISPHRLHSVKQFLWYPEYKPDNGVYRCSNDYLITTPK